MSPRFFAHLRDVYETAVAELARDGFTEVYRWDCLPNGPWPRGWLNCRALQVYARKPGSKSWRRAEESVDPRPFERKVRAVKRFTEKKVRRVRRAGR